MEIWLCRPISGQPCLIPRRGQLSSLAIEPLLCQLRGWLSGISLPGSSDFERLPTVLACADDDYTFVSSQEDIFCLQDTMSLYEKASPALMNWVKSETLIMGQWGNQAVPSLPGGRQGRTESVESILGQ